MVVDANMHWLPEDLFTDENLREAFTGCVPCTPRDDVRNELVSAGMARRVYRIVVDPETFEIDQAGTTALRQASGSTDGTEQRAGERLSVAP